MEELFNIIGKLYVDIYNTQKVLDMLQKQIQEQDAEIVRLKQTRTKDE
jgi:flavodoxin